MEKKRILIIGNAKEGKNKVAHIINETYGIKYLSRSKAALKFVYEILKDILEYKDEKECYLKRIEDNDYWEYIIDKYNNKDKARFTKEMLMDCQCRVGMTDIKEFMACRGLFDIIVWVHSCRKDKSMNIKYTDIEEYVTLTLNGDASYKDLQNETITKFKSYLEKETQKTFIDL